MADEVNIPVLKSLGEADYYGMDPAQMLQVAANERANDTLNYNLANSMVTHQKTAEKLALDYAQTKREMQFKQFKEQFDQKAKIIDMDLATKRLAIQDKMADALATKNTLLAEKLQLDIDKIDSAKNVLANSGNDMYYINGSNVPKPFRVIMAMKDMGAPVVFSPNQKVNDLVKNEKTGEYMILFNNGSTKPVKEFYGKDIKSVGGGGVNINLGMDEIQKKAEATATGSGMGKMTANLLSPEAWDESIKSLEAADPLFMGNKIADPVGTNVKVINHMLQRASALPSAKGKTLQYIPGRGVFEVFPDNKGGFKKDASGNLVLGKQFTMPSSLE